MTAMLLWRNLKNERNLNNYGIPSSHGRDDRGLLFPHHPSGKQAQKAGRADAQQPEKAEPVSRYDRILSRITPFLQPKFFLFSAGCIVCLVSLALNIRFVERMQQLQDNDIKYRYLLMKGKAEGSDINLLEMNFSRERDNAFIQSLTDTVIDFEYRSRKQAEALERVRLLNEQAEQLKEEAGKFGKP